MTQSGSVPYGKKAKEALNKGYYSKDKNIKKDAPNLIQNVTNRDLVAVQRNEILVRQLESFYKLNSQNNEPTIINDFVNIIKAYLGM